MVQETLEYGSHAETTPSQKNKFNNTQITSIIQQLNFYKLQYNILYNNLNARFRVFYGLILVSACSSYRKTLISGLPPKSRHNGRTVPGQAPPGSMEDLLQQILTVSNFDYKNKPSIN